MPSTPKIPQGLSSDSGQSHVPPFARSTGAKLPLSRWDLGSGGTREAGRTADSDEVYEVPSFELLAPVASGGMGEVWEARQNSLGRVVAVKRLKRGNHDDPEKLRDAEYAFRQESLLTALLEHPNIVPVHDLGLDAAGSSLLAMKLVRGKPWGKFLHEDWDIPVSDYLARHLPILIDVAQAVAFAHSKGIIHRDLKPSQVMIGPFGETLLMDWGLGVVYAPAAERDLRESTMLTHMLPTLDTASNPAGTPAMMAPEQTVEDARGLGPWTDVFLLGGILYVILAGEYPYVASDSTSAIRMAYEHRLVPPAERAPGREVPPELERICLKAMARERADRYASASEFVEAVQDYLNGSSRRREAQKAIDGVEAQLARGGLSYTELADALGNLERARSLWPDSPGARRAMDRLLGDYARAALKGGDLKLARVQAERLEPSGDRIALLRDIDESEKRAAGVARQRRAFAFAALALCLAIAAGGCVFSYTMKSKNDELAQRNAAIERERASALNRAKANQKLIAFMLEDLSRELDPNAERDAKIIAQIAARAMEHYRTLDTANDSREVRIVHALDLRDSAATLMNFARLDDALALGKMGVDAALSVQPPDSRTQSNTLLMLGNIRKARGERDEAKACYEESLALLEKLPKEEADYMKPTRLSSLGTIASQNGDPKGAVEYYRKAAALQEATPDAYPHHVAMTLNNLAWSLYELNELDEAERHARRSIEIEKGFKEGRPEDVTTPMNTLSAILAAKGRMEESDRLLEEALAISEKVFGPEHPDVSYLLANIASRRIDADRFEEALALLDRAVAIDAKVLGKRHPSYAQHRRAQGMALMFLKRLPEAEAAIRECIDIVEKELGPDDPQVAQNLHALAGLLHHSGKVAEALETERRALKIMKEKMPPGHPELKIVEQTVEKLEEAAAKPPGS